MNPYFNDPQNPATWINCDAPHIPGRYAAELTALGGLNPYGEPLLKFTWGKRRTWFFAGRERLLYVDTRIPARETLYYVKNGKVFDTEDEAFADPEFGIAVRKRRLEWVGQPLFFVEQWRPAELVSTPQRWERERWGRWEDPETGEAVERCDLLGDYPARGQYRTIYAVSDDGVTGRPVGADTIEEVRRAAWHHRHDKEQTVGQRVKELHDLQERKDAAQRAERVQMAKDHLLPHAHRFMENYVSPYPIVGGRNRPKGKVLRVA